MSKLRQSMSASTVARKMFLRLNCDLWEPNPELTKMTTARKWSFKDFCKTRRAEEEASASRRRIYG